jgi:HEAT repeat protein
MSGEPTRDPARKRRLRALAVVLAAAVVALWIQWGWFRPVNHMIRALRSEDSAARLAAAVALGRAAPEDAPAAIPALVDALGDAEAQVGAEAAESLGSLGAVAMVDPGARGSIRVAVAALSRAVADRRAEVRAAAAGALGQIAGRVPPGGDPPFDPGPVADALAGAMGDPSAQVRAVASKSLSVLAVKTAIAPPAGLLAALGPAGPADRREEALAVLPAFRDHLGEVIPRLVDALSDRDPSVRYRAAVVLGEAGAAAQAAIPALIAVLGEPVDPRPAAPALSPTTRPQDQIARDRWDPACAAARALARIAPAAGATAAQEAVAALTGALRSGQDLRRNAAAEGLFLLGKGAAAATPALSSALTESVATEGDGRGANSWAARALGLAAPGTAAEAAAIAALTRGLDSSAQGTRAYSADSLARFGRPAASALPRLRALRGDPDRFVAAMARSAVARLEGAPVPVGPTGR